MEVNSKINKPIKPKSCRFLVYYNNVIICERFWGFKTLPVITNEMFSEVVTSIDSHLNDEFKSNQIAFNVTVRVETPDSVVEKEIPIRNRQPKLLYRLDLKPILDSIRLKLGLIKREPKNK